jgi:hypothetical protein
MYFRLNPCTAVDKKAEGCTANCCYKVGPAKMLEMLQTGEGEKKEGPKEEESSTAVVPAGQRKLLSTSRAHFDQWFDCGDRLSWVEDTHHPEGGVTQRYRGGTQSNLCALPALNVEMSINFVCDPNAGLGTPTTAKDFEEEARRCKYRFIWRTDQVCSGSLSRGWIFTIVFLVGMALYCIGGFIFNIKKKGLEGRDAMPHRSFWIADLPELVKDGFNYFLILCRKAIDRARGKSEYTSIEDPEQVPT